MNIVSREMYNVRREYYLMGVQINVESPELLNKQSRYNSLLVSTHCLFLVLKGKKTENYSQRFFWKKRLEFMSVYYCLPWFQIHFPFCSRFCFIHILERGVSSIRCFCSLETCYNTHPNVLLKEKRLMGRILSSEIWPHGKLKLLSTE